MVGNVNQQQHTLFIAESTAAFMELLWNMAAEFVITATQLEISQDKSKFSGVIAGKNFPDATTYDYQTPFEKKGLIIIAINIFKTRVHVVLERST